MANLVKRALLKLTLLKNEKIYNQFNTEDYLDKMEDIFDYRTAVKTRKDPNWHHGNYNVKAEAYGIGHLYQRYSGYNGEINCSFEHSLPFSRTNNESEYRDIQYPVIISSSKARWDIIQPLTDKIVIPCGCFFMPYGRSIYDEFLTGVIKKNLGKTLLVFPQHNNINSFYEGEEETKEAFFKQVEAIKNEHGFDTVIVCLYFADILNQTYRQYEDRGWIVVSAGRSHNYDFGDNMVSIISLADHVIVQDSIASLVQAAYMNKPCTFMKGRALKRMADGRMSNTGKEVMFEERQEECLELFGEYSEELSSAQMEWCNRWGGFDCTKSPDEIRLILEFAKELGKKPITDARLKRVLAKSKYDLIRKYIEPAIATRIH